MSASTNWVVAPQHSDGEQPTSSELVMAWALDSETKEPRYIGELGPSQRGSMCGCECASCGLPLTAVNAAKRVYIKRPHFRHPGGTEKDSCMILAARVAALNMFERDGVLELPRYRKSSSVRGLSGMTYEAWVERKSERVRIADFKLVDKVGAILRLDDGRELIVQLVGQIDPAGPSAEGGEHPVPTILINVDDPRIASLSPTELRKRIQLLVQDGTWCSHWDSAAADQEAQRIAIGNASNSLDWLDDGFEVGADLPAELKRETLLHLKAKEILESQKRIQLPDVLIEASDIGPDGWPVHRRRNIEGPLVELHSVRLETQLGNTRPDVIAESLDSGIWFNGPLSIEVTVTNSISQERIARIQANGIPAMEIDLSSMGGMVTVDEFARLIVEEKAGKRWIYHPMTEQERSKLMADIQVAITRQIEHDEEEFAEAQFSEHALEISPSIWAKSYLDAISVLGGLKAKEEYPGSGITPSQISEAESKVKECAKALSIHRYYGAGDDWLINGRCILRLLSIKHDRAIGYNLETAWQVINTILQEKSENSLQWQTLYLIAIKVYRPTLNRSQMQKIRQWREKVWTSIENNEMTYKRARKHDALLSLLFPEMADSLAMPLVR